MEWHRLGTDKMENQVEHVDKKTVTMKYSESKMGTEKLVMDVHRRIRYAKNADTNVHIGDKIYPCHAVALEVVSKYFDELNRSQDSMRRIDLPETEVPSSTFPTLMDWILQDDQGRGSVITKTNVVPLFSCAKFLDIPDLKSQCINFLQEKVETNDRYLMPIWEEVKKRQICHELMVVISAKAAMSFQHIFKERKFLNLDVDELVMLLSSDDIVIESELDVFETVVQWLLFEWESRKVFTNEVMYSVRFGLLTPLQLTQISQSPKLAKSALCPHEYSELLAYGSVKAMIDDGLAFSIVHESYKSNPEELRKWVDSTGIKAPRERCHSNPSSCSKIFSVPNDIRGPRLGHHQSFALHPTNPLSYNAPKTYSQETSSNSNSFGLPSTPDSSVLDRRNKLPRPSSRQRDGEKGPHFDGLVDALGQPMNEQDIQNVGQGHWRNRNP